MYRDLVLAQQRGLSHEYLSEGSCNLGLDGWSEQHDY